MRKSIEELKRKVDWIDADNLYQAVADIKQVLDEMLDLIDQALPTEVEPD